MMITLIKPLLIAFVQTSAVKNLIVDLLAVCAARTDNKIEEISTDTKNDEWEKAKEETIETTDEKSDKNMREIIENIF